MQKRKFNIPKKNLNSIKKDLKNEVKPIPRKKNLSFDDLKKQLLAWIETEHIPGKVQAWFTGEVQAENSDWRIYNKLINGHESLAIDAPAFEMNPPNVVSLIFEQLHKEHLRALRKSIRSLWLRSTGDGRFALVIQANLRGKNSAHENKTFLEFIQRSCPEVISYHQIQCVPNISFNPTEKLTSRIESRCYFGNNLLPLADTGFYMHVLDWAPRIKDIWLRLPLRIAEAIHPARGDKFFEFYSASSFISASLASQFQQLESLDCRETAMESTQFNKRALAENNLRFHRTQFDANAITKFFSKTENEGKWTFYFNLPSGEALPTASEPVIASARPERILVQTKDLDIATKIIKRFRNEEYVLRKIIPLYLEPGSSSFEILLLFVPDRAGLLGRNSLKTGKNWAVKRPKEQPKGKKTPDMPHFIQKVPSFNQRKG